MLGKKTPFLFSTVILLLVHKMKRRKDDLERYLANPPGFLDIEVAKAKRILDKKRSALSKQVDSFNSAIEQPNGVCSKAGVGAALQLVQLATTGVIDSTKFNWLQASCSSWSWRLHRT
jgi:hypothetical protein